jgi:hypothetical protein
MGRKVHWVGSKRTTAWVETAGSNRQKKETTVAHIDKARNDRHPSHGTGAPWGFVVFCQVAILIRTKAIAKKPS